MCDDHAGERAERFDRVQHSFQVGDELAQQRRDQAGEFVAMQQQVEEPAGSLDVQLHQPRQTLVQGGCQLLVQRLLRRGRLARVASALADTAMSHPIEELPQPDSASQLRRCLHQSQTQGRWPLQPFDDRPGERVPVGIDDQEQARLVRWLVNDR